MCKGELWPGHATLIGHGGREAWDGRSGAAVRDPGILFKASGSNLHAKRKRNLLI